MFEEYSIKIQWIRTHCNIAVASEFRDMVIDSVEHAFSHNTLPKRVMDSIVLDLSYCILRNLRWIRLPIFRDVILDYLISNYSLDAQSCERLIDHLTSAASRLATTNDLDGVSDREFLRYLFVFGSLCTASNELPDFGFGQAIFKRINNAISIVDDMDNDTNEKQKACFLPEIDAAFVDIIFDLTMEQRENPAALDSLLLQYLFYNLGPEEKVRIHQVGVERIFALLIFLGKKRISSVDEVARAFSEQEYEVIVLMLEVLKKIELAYLAGCSTNSRKNQWSLTSLGYRITARSFAKEFLNAESIEMQLVLKLAPEYQSEVFRQAPESYLIDSLSSNRQELVKLSPAGLTSMLRRLATGEQRFNVMEFAGEVVANIKLNPWVRTLACVHLSQNCDQEEVRQLLKNVAESDSSFIVKDAALNGLRNGIDGFVSKTN